MKRQSQHIWRGTLRLQRSMARLTINIQPQLALLKPTHKKESYSDDASDLEYCRTFKPVKKKKSVISSASLTASLPFSIPQLGN